MASWVMTAFTETGNLQREATWGMRGMTSVWGLCCIWVSHGYPFGDIQEVVGNIGLKFIEEIGMKDLGRL